MTNETPAAPAAEAAEPREEGDRDRLDAIYEAVDALWGALNGTDRPAMSIPPQQALRELVQKAVDRLAVRGDVFAFYCYTQGHGDPDRCVVHGDIPRTKSIVDHVREVHGLTYEQYLAQCPPDAPDHIPGPAGRRAAAQPGPSEPGLRERIEQFARENSVTMQAHHPNDSDAEVVYVDELLAALAAADATPPASEGLRAVVERLYRTASDQRMGIPSTVWELILKARALADSDRVDPAPELPGLCSICDGVRDAGVHDTAEECGMLRGPCLDPGRHHPFTVASEARP